MVTPDHEIPASGISKDDLAVSLGLTGPAMLAWLGRREVSGQVRIEGDQVFPGGR